MAATASQTVTQIARNEGLFEEKPARGVPGRLALQQRDTAQYVADMILELRNMAKAAKLFTVMVPLEYSYYEAFSLANQVSAPPEEVERLRQLAAAAKEAEDAVVEDS